MVGVVNTLVDASVFFVAYSYLTSSLIVANVLAWCAGVTCSYVLNSNITFAVESGRKLSLRGYGAFGSIEPCRRCRQHDGARHRRRLPPVWGAKGCAILVSFIVNFSMSNFVVFRRRDH